MRLEDEGGSSAPQIVEFLVERKVEVVVEDHHCPMVDGKPAEAALELVAIDDRAQVLPGRRVGRQDVEVGRPLPGPASLGVAGAHEEPVRPGVKARRVAEPRKVLPDGEQRVGREAALALGFTGPMLRGSGVNVGHFRPSIHVTLWS